MIPDAIYQRNLALAEAVSSRPVSKVAAAFILAIWGALAFVIWRLVSR